MRIEPLENEPEVLDEFIEIEMSSLVHVQTYYIDTVQQLAYFLYLYDTEITEIEDFKDDWSVEEQYQKNWNGKAHKQYYEMAQEFLKRHGDLRAKRFITYVNLWDRLGR